MRVRNAVLALLVLLSVITYMDRICIAVAAPRMQAEFGISDEGWGWVMAAFTLSYGLLEIPSGAWGDRYGQRRVLTRIVAWWSAFTVLTGMASNYFWLLATRFLFGVGEAGAYPNASGSVRHWFPVGERARAQGCIWGASRIGGALTPPLVVPLMALLGWRSVFVLFGALGFVWAVAWFLWYRDTPSQHPAVTESELTETATNVAMDEHAGVPWRSLARNRRLWLLMAMYCCYAWGSTFYISWLPKYLTKARGFGDGEMALFASLPFIMGAIGNLCGGLLSDRLTRTRGARVGRVLQGALCLALSSALLMMTALTSNRWVAVVLLTLGFGVLDCMLPCAWAICLDVGGRYAGAVSGAMNSAGQAGGFLCNALFGYLVTWYGNHNGPLIVIASMVMVSSVLFLMIDPIRPLTATDKRILLAEEPQCV